jgi:hypothetical protein
MSKQTKAAMYFGAAFILGCLGLWIGHGGCCMAAFLLSCVAFGYFREN